MPWIDLRTCLIGYRHLVDPGPDQYVYTGEGGREQQQHQTNPRQKNAMTAAV